MPGVMPEPSAAFSPLAITKSRASRFRSAGRAFCTSLRPGLPTMSPMRRMRSTMVARRVSEGVLEVDRPFRCFPRLRVGLPFHHNVLSRRFHVAEQRATLTGNVTEPRLSYHRHANLARIRQLLFEC